MTYCFELAGNDQRIFIPDGEGYDYLNQEFIDWLQTLFGPVSKATGTWGTGVDLYGEMWCYVENSTDGLHGRCLSFDRSQDAAIFKLTYSYDYEIC